MFKKTKATHKVAFVDEFLNFSFKSVKGVFKRVNVPRKILTSLPWLMQTGMFGDTVGKNNKVLHCSKSAHHALLFCKTVFPDSNIADPKLSDSVGISPKWEYLITQFNDMISSFDAPITEKELLDTVVDHVGMLKLPYLGMLPTVEDCQHVTIKPDAAAGDLGNLSIASSPFRHYKYPYKQGSLAASLLSFLKECVQEVNNGLVPKMESFYKVSHRERVIKCPLPGEEKEVQTRTVCAPSGGTKIFGSLYLQCVNRS